MIAVQFELLYIKWKVHMVIKGKFNDYRIYDINIKPIKGCFSTYDLEILLLDV